jgi:riboflavin kinase/FMN adenylyltransferase
LRHIRGSAALEQPIRRTIVTIGNFDGIHLGHQAILKTVVGRAADLEGQAVVYTFDPHPRKVLRPEKAPPLLTTLEQKLELLEQAGVDAVVVEPFTPEFSRTFGRDREGSMRMLTEVGPRLGFSVTIIPEVTVDAGDVNSTRIRQLLAEGEAESAARMLGRPFTIRGYVVRGDERGRTLGFPTANVEPENEVVPAAGVYAGHLHLLDEGDPAAGTRLPAVINVGRRPTFGDGRGLVAEAHAIDCSGDFYDRRVELSFSSWLRAEQRFSGADALSEQIRRDVETARRRLASR